jgi:hypothetical protein
MGSLGPLPQGCSLSGTLVTCQLGGILKGRSKSVSLNLALAHAEKVLQLDASVTSQSVDASSSNNNASLVPALNYDQVVMGDAIVKNSHCTGSSTLSSYLECVYAPSSISEHYTTFFSNGTLETEDPSVTGNWSQSSALGTQALHFEYIENGQILAWFDGKAVDGDCFEGVTRFTQNSAYVSPYRVCIQR